MSGYTVKNPSIKKLVAISRELKDLSSVIGLLAWDQETYLPANSGLARARQLETLSGLLHEKATAKKIAHTIEKAKVGALSDYDTALVREMGREYQIATKLPKRLVQNISKQASLGLESWKKARAESSFSFFAKDLEKMILLKREVAECIGYSDSPYDALLDEFEPGMTKKEVLRIFDTFKEELKKLIPVLSAKTASFDHRIFSQSFDGSKLWDFSMHLLTLIGFDLQSGRQDHSTHPFTVGVHSSDVRLTTRIVKQNPISTLLSSIHEGGHGMYEQGIGSDIADTILGSTNSLVIHESQSRFWENMIARSPAFWEYIFPHFQKIFRAQLAHTTWQEVWEEVNRVRPSLVRVDADEVTYHLHIIIRTLIEIDLIEGKLKTKDVPERWNSLYKEYLGIDVPNDTVGCLQDIHWSQGLIGYFPTYSMGSLLAAQLYESIQKIHPELQRDIQSGKFEKIRQWLKENIHRHGRIYSAEYVAENLTGRLLSADSYLRHIKEKFEL